jgi:hypothetical protein
MKSNDQLGEDVSCWQIAERTNTTFQLSSFYARTQIQTGLLKSDETCSCEPGPGVRVAAEEIPSREKVAKEKQ